MRQCETCSKELVRNMWIEKIEPLHRFEKRRFCSRECSSHRRDQKKSSSQGFADMAPILLGEVERTNRCWAGFKAGRRCVKDRDGHPLHRDVAGNEWSGIVPHAAECFERTPVDPYYESASLLRAQR